MRHQMEASRGKKACGWHWRPLLRRHAAFLGGEWLEICTQAHTHTSTTHMHKRKKLQLSM